MSDERAREAPSERFEAAYLEFDLAAEAASLRSEAVPARHGHRQKTLFKHGGRTIALFVMNRGSSLSEHAADGTVTIQAVEGVIRIGLAGDDRRLRAGQVMVLRPGLPHGVAAETDAVFLLQVSLGM
ncbi:MAG TPA: cupin domain-containing protein [Phycisphaerales bacterium]|nr:cupin domain-containing protein [Phycisphaerales bacterium]